jgi:hypothetical protein
MILALDLASVTGWACGEPGGVPVHGSIRFASAGASHEAVFTNAFTWLSRHCQVHSPSIMVWEAPLATIFKRGSTNSNTTTLLYGLPAVAGLVAYRQGIYDIRKADTRDVRNHFIGSNPKRVTAKPMVMSQCRKLGWQVEDDNEADALALWSYMCALIEPKQALRPTPLFGGA